MRPQARPAPPLVPDVRARGARRRPRSARARSRIRRTGLLPELQGHARRLERLVVRAAFVEQPTEIVRSGPRQSPPQPRARRARSRASSRCENPRHPGLPAPPCGRRRPRDRTRGRRGTLERDHEERVRGGRVAARPQHPATFEGDAYIDERLPGADASRSVEQVAAPCERAAQPFDARQLRQRLRPTRVVGLPVELLRQPALAQVEIVEVPESPQPIVMLGRHRCSGLFRDARANSRLLVARSAARPGARAGLPPTRESGGACG